MTCETLQGKYAEKLEREIKKMNKEIELLYKKLDAQDEIIDQQALEIARLKEDKKKAIEYIKEYGRDKQLEEDYLMSRYNLALYNITLLEILGDKENE